MLVLSRRVGERLMIGDDIVVTVLEVRSDGVRLGIDAPRYIAVNRAEVLEAVKEANLAATAATDAAVETLRRLIPPLRPPSASTVAPRLVRPLEPPPESVDGAARPVPPRSSPVDGPRPVRPRSAPTVGPRLVPPLEPPSE